MAVLTAIVRTARPSLFHTLRADSLAPPALSGSGHCGAMGQLHLLLAQLLDIVAHALPHCADVLLVKAELGKCVPT